MKTRKLLKRNEWTRVYSETKKLEIRHCVICGKKLERKCYGKKHYKRNGKIYSYNSYEDLKKFCQRKTCGKKQNKEGKWIYSECYKKFREIPENNGNYKGIMPKCVDCGKKLRDYKIVAYKKRCRKCFKKWAYEGLERKHGFKIGNNINKFKKGHIPWNTRNN